MDPELRLHLVQTNGQVIEEATENGGKPEGRRPETGDGATGDGSSRGKAGRCSGGRQSLRVALTQDALRGRRGRGGHGKVGIYDGDHVRRDLLACS